CMLVSVDTHVSVFMPSFACVIRPFFFIAPPAPVLSPLSLHDALPIWPAGAARRRGGAGTASAGPPADRSLASGQRADPPRPSRRSEEHTSELQSREKIVCRLLLEKKKKQETQNIVNIITQCTQHKHVT